MIDTKFQVGDLVWAKMHTHGVWPGRITTPKTFLKSPNQPSECIFFFGSRNYNYVENGNIKPYYEYKSKFSKASTSQDFLDALSDIEDFINRKESDPNYDPELNLHASENSTEEDEEEVEKPKQRKRRRMAPTKTPKANKMMKNEAPEAPTTASKNGSQTEDNKKGCTITKIDFDSANSRAADKDAAYKPLLVMGILGVGKLGKTVITGLVKTGHKVNIWNRTMEKAEKFKEEIEEKYPGKVTIFDRCSDVLRNSDIIFSCVLDSTAVKNVTYGSYFGLFHEVDRMENKGYVELSNVGIEASIEMGNLIKDRGGRYMEAQLQRSSSSNEDDSFIVLAAGHEKLFDECSTTFQAIGKAAFYLGNVGSACKMNLIMQVIKGVTLVGLTESFELARKCGLKLQDVEEIFNITTMSSPFLQEIVNDIVNSGPVLDTTIGQLHNDIKNALDFSDVLKQPLLMAASVREAIIRHISS